MAFICFFLLFYRYVFSFDGKNVGGAANQQGPVLTGKLSSVDSKTIGGQTYKTYMFSNGRSATVITHEEVHVIAPHIAVAFDSLSSALEVNSSLSELFLWNWYCKFLLCFPF